MTNIQNLNIENKGSTEHAGFSRLFIWLLIALFAVGLTSRIGPLLNQDGRLLQQYPTEDGYLMLTIARNLAIGNGMSTADGTIPTNGTQPGATFIYAFCYWLVNGDKVAGVRLILALQAVVALASSFMIYKLGRVLLADRPQGVPVAALSAGVWFSAGGFVPHTMNCLETGLFVFTILLAVHYFIRIHRREDRKWSYARVVILGALLGLCFWMRNDAALLIAAICLVHLFWKSRMYPVPWTRRLSETFLIGITSVIIALPWLIYNYISFGHLMPISGISEAAYITVGENLDQLPIVIAEYALVVIPIPASLVGNAAIWFISLAIVFGWLFLVTFITQRARKQEQLLILTVGLFGLGLAVFYGLFFGAGHFLARYFFPLSPFTTLLWSWTAIYLWNRAVSYLAEKYNKPMLRWTTYLAPATIVLLALALNVRLYMKGDRHEHFQVVRWVADNVPESAWVGAPQTGTLGYYHDRTINLDGKVNPEALEARLRNRIPDYVVHKDIHYLADWVGLAKWKKLPQIRSRYELIVEDHQKNLAVLKKTDMPHKYAPKGVTGRVADSLH